MAKPHRKTKHYKKFKARKLFKRCQFCKEGNEPDYKKFEKLNTYLSSAGKITPRKINGNCAKHQRRLAQAVKRARFLALLPFMQKVRKK